MGWALSKAKAMRGFARVRCYWLLPLIAIGGAALAQTPEPKIAPVDPSAHFSGNGSSVKFDPTCRDYTLAEVATNPACAARIERGETAPSLAIGVHSAGAAKTQEERARAFAVIERAIAVENHPAAHYLLGSLLSGGEAGPPDFERAVHHLGLAAAGGNAAAMDLLATLTLTGRGTVQDKAKALSLLEQAAAAGMAGSALRLAMFHLDGKFAPIDQKRGFAISKAASLVNIHEANQIMAAIAMPITQYQAEPSETGVTVKSYGALDNPAIPPAFGFTQAVRALYYGDFDDPGILALLEREADTLPTPFLYELARRLTFRDPQRALETYMLARLRMTYDAGRCADATANQALVAWDRLILGEIGYAVNTADMAAAKASAKTREATMPRDTRPWWVCYSGMATYLQADTDAPRPLALKPEAEWPQVRADALAKFEEIGRNTQ